jgi:hypothetical protein
MSRITVEQYFMGRDKAHPPSTVLRQNAAITVALANEMLDEAAIDGVPLTRMDQITGNLVASGYRPAAVNERTANAAKSSTHLTCEGIDIQDSRNQDLARWCLKNLPILERLGLYMEDPRWTYSVNGDHWVHVQTRPPRSGRRVFVPSSAPPRGPELT